MKKANSHSRNVFPKKKIFLTLLDIKSIAICLKNRKIKEKAKKKKKKISKIDGERKGFKVNPLPLITCSLMLS